MQARITLDEPATNIIESIDMLLKYNSSLPADWAASQLSYWRTGNLIFCS